MPAHLMGVAPAYVAATIFASNMAWTAWVVSALSNDINRRLEKWK
jgi:hypothetical protein